jgi:4'-phosphopantetheinyl transferase
MQNVDIWHLSFSDASASSDPSKVSMETLSLQEQVKAKAFVNEEDRKKYILSHLFLRRILSHYFPSISPKEWCFEENRYGKPYLHAKHGITFHFNLSHSQSHVYIICSEQYICGIDVEESKNIPLTGGVSALLFSEEELAVYKRLSSKNKERMFYLYWTLKEAHLKALGSGLMELELIALNFEPFVDLHLDENFFKSEDHQYWSYSLDEGVFLSFCLLYSAEMIHPRYFFSL